MKETDQRKELLLASGAAEAEATEFLAYAVNRFDLPDVLPPLPLADELFTDVWRNYAELTAIAGSFEPLQFKLVQLAFPVESGMSGDPQYRAATRRGDLPAEPVRGGAMLRHPETCQIKVHDSFAGGIGIVAAADRADFETLVRVFTERNEPIPIRASMGATMVSGFNNWHRIHLLKDAFLRSGKTAQGWMSEFSRIQAQKDLYQDRFIIVSSGPYSGVDAKSLGLEQEDWLVKSRTIRLEHEYAHYFTRRVFGSMQSNLLDEMMADYAGLRIAFGFFRAQWMLLFLGLESYPNYREGGRLQNYRGNPPLSDGAFRLLMRLVQRAAWNLQQFDCIVGTACSLPDALMAIASMNIDELAADSAPRLLTQLYAAAQTDSSERELSVAQTMN